MSRLDAALQRGLSLEGLRSLRANRVYDKLAVLVGITALAGFLSASMVGRNAAVAPLVLPTMAIAFGCSMLGQFKPNLAKTVAPIYALAEGVVLGVVSKAYSNYGNGIVPTAIVATGALFVGCLLVFRSGAVKVTPRFMQMAFAAGWAMFALYIAAMFGLAVPGINEIGPKGMIFGVIGLGIGLSYLFIDFDRIRKAEEAQQLSDTAEWYLAFRLLISLVLVYVNVLRIIASSQRSR